MMNDDRSYIDVILFRKSIASLSDAKNYSDLVHALLLAASTHPRSREDAHEVSQELFDFIREIDRAQMKVMMPLLGLLHDAQVSRFKQATNGQWDQEAVIRVSMEDSNRAADERVFLSSESLEALVVELMSANAPTLVTAVVGSLVEFLAERGDEVRSLCAPIIGRLADAIVASAYARAKVFTRHHHFRESLAGAVSPDGISLDMPVVLGHLMTSTWASNERDQGRIYAWASDRGRERIAIDS